MTKRAFQNATYDTSVYHEILKNSPKRFASIINKLNLKDKFGLYYSIIELNLGMVSTWVEYFQSVQIYEDRAISLAKISNKYGRGTKNVLILESLIASMNEVTPNNDKQMYLAQIEAAILAATTVIESSVKSFLGAFRSHPLAIFQTDDREQYDNFLKVCTDSKLVDVTKFVKDNTDSFKKLNAHTQELLKTRDNKLLREVDSLITNALTNPDTCNLVRNNRKYGDIIIAIDVPKSHKLVTKDQSFNILSSGLAKEHKVLSI